MKSSLSLEFQQFLDTLAKNGGAPIFTLSPQEARKVLASAQNIPVIIPPVTVQELTLPVYDAQGVKVRIVRPKDIQNPLPVVIYFHGGGWVLGDFSTHERLVSELAHGAHVAVIFVEFSCAPEAQFPVAQEQAYAVIQWVSEQGASHGLLATHITVAGDSAGGHMAIGVCMMAKKHNGPRIAQQLLFYPVTDASLKTASYELFEKGYFLEKEGMRWFWDEYMPNAQDRKSSLGSPILASMDELKGLPPALVITAENDVLRDEGEAFAHKLMQAGVPVVATRYLGVTHDFMMLNAVTQAPPVRAAIAQAIHMLRRQK